MDPFIGEIKFTSFNFPPRGWALCNGQTLPINQNQALFSLLGTTYGGNGSTTFNLPNLQGRVPVHVGQGISLGGTGGAEQHSLTIAEMPTHQHALNVNSSTPATSNTNAPTAGKALGASIGHPSSGADFPLNVYNSTLANPIPVAGGMVGTSGGSQPHENRQPFQVVSACIALTGIYPSRS